MMEFLLCKKDGEWYFTRDTNISDIQNCYIISKLIKDGMHEIIVRFEFALYIMRITNSGKLIKYPPSTSNEGFRKCEGVTLDL